MDWYARGFGSTGGGVVSVGEVTTILGTTRGVDGDAGAEVSGVDIFDGTSSGVARVDGGEARGVDGGDGGGPAAIQRRR